MSGLADCFDYDRKLIPVADAVLRLRMHAQPVAETQIVALRDAFGRILASDIHAHFHVPSFTNAAVDGWAFAWSEEINTSGATLTIRQGRAAAGHPWKGRLAAGECLRVLTGAVMPEGADSVALQEETRESGNSTVLPSGLKQGANCRPAGEDMTQGSRVLSKGHRLRAQDIGALALLGLAEVPLFKPLRLGLFSSGDELLEPGMPWREGAVFDANRHILMAAASRLPCEVTDLGRLADDRAAVERALQDAAGQFDAVITSGGASQGDEDHIARTLRAHGSIHFWRIALKPGRPLAFGQIGECLFVGLPGNPVAASVCFGLFARPLLLALAGMPWQQPTRLEVEAGFAMKKHRGRTEMVRVRLEMHEGRAVAQKIPKQGSGVLTSLVDADGLLEVGPESGAIELGRSYPYHGFFELGLA